MYKVLKLDKIDSQGLAVFPADDYDIGTELSNPQAILLRSFKMHDMVLPDTLLAVGRAGAGVNNIPIDKCSEKGIVVFNTPGANANAVKELTLAGLFLASRDVYQGMAYVQGLKGSGEDVAALVEKNKKYYAGVEIAGKTLGVVGLGKIGVMVANAARDLGMNVVGYDPFISVESAWGLSRDVKRAESLDSMLGKSDYVTLHMPLTPDTRGMLNETKFKVMKKGARILNFSRGEIVNNADMAAAIKAGVVARYVTDFPDGEVLDMDKVIIIPHLGASTAEAETNCAVMVAKQVRDFLENGNITNSVNFPALRLEQNSGCRLVVMNKNIPNMVGQISTVLANAGVNIVEMLNRSKGNWASNLIDVEKPLEPNVLDALYRIDGVVKVRYLQMGQ
jgi:D-3-phosphoglycerate dehydrogenase